VGIYYEGKLYYEDFPSDLTQTWTYSGALKDQDIEYASLFCGGLTLAEACPVKHLEELKSAQKRFRAYLKSFELAKVNMRDHCIFDLVPQDFLKKFCEIKNKVTAHVIGNYAKPDCYDHLQNVARLLHTLKYQHLHLTNEGCKKLHYSSSNSMRIKRLLGGPTHVDYNLFGTVTGRLTTRANSFPILTLQKEFRKLVKPHNDWLLSLDYNAAEVRTFIALAGEDQPQEDVHEWHIKNLIREEISRQEAKVKFFAWIYNSEAPTNEFEAYKREDVLDQWYDGDFVYTPFKRKIKVDKRKALNYIIQSTTADLVLDRAVAIDKFLEDKKSFIAFIVHDEIVIDLANDEKHLVPEIKKMFATNKLDQFLVNLNCGKDYGSLEELKL
jgi:hypothetical protein